MRTLWPVSGSRTPLRAARFFSIAILAIGWTVLTAGGGQAAGGEQITKYGVGLVLNRDGSMHVQETIDYDFGTTTDHHGITRDIPVEFTYDQDRVREYPISNISVDSPSGAPHDLARTSGPQRRCGSVTRTRP